TPVDQVDRRPRLIAITGPRLEIVVDGDRIRDRMLAQIAPHALDVVLVAHLGGVNADHDEPAIPVLPVPRLHVRLDVPAVVTTERPELDEHDLAGEVGAPQWWRIQPSVAADLWRGDADRERSRAGEIHDRRERDRDRRRAENS